MSENQLVKLSVENIETTTTTNRTSSITSSIGQLIRLNLPNIGNQLRRLIGLNINPIVNDDNHVDNIDDNEASNLPNIQQDLIINSSRITQTISIQSFNFYDYLASEIPSTSSYSTHDDDDDYDGDDDDDDDDDDSIFTSPPGTPAPLMISSGVNTGPPHIFISRLVSDDGVIITGNPNDFIAALNARVGRGISGESQVPFEPQRIPLFFSSNENRNYAINSVAINSSSSSSSGSWSSSSDIDGFEQSESFRQRQNEARQFYENNDSSRQSVRKHLRNLDDEPPIY